MTQETFEPLHVLAELHARRVRYVLVGDLAAMAHGSLMSADRIELCIADDDEDVARLGTVLQLLEAEEDQAESDPHRVVFHTAAGRVEFLDLSDAGGYERLRTRATDVDLGHGVVAPVAAPEDVAVQQLADDDLVAAVRTASFVSRDPIDPVPTVPDEDEYPCEPISLRTAPWRRIWKAFEDVDKFLTDLNEGTMPRSHDRRR
jgi:hypothetical protein